MPVRCAVLPDSGERRAAHLEELFVSAHISMPNSFPVLCQDGLRLSHIYKCPEEAGDYSGLDSFKITRGRKSLKKRVEGGRKESISCRSSPCGSYLVSCVCVLGLWKKGIPVKKTKQTKSKRNLYPRDTTAKEE